MHNSDQILTIVFCFAYYKKKDLLRKSLITVQAQAIPLLTQLHSQK